MKTLNLFILLLGLSLVGCSGMVNKMHRQFDRHDNNRRVSPSHDKFSIYRKGQRPPQRKGYPRRFKNPKQLSSRSNSRQSPSVKRMYVPQQSAKQRYKAEDLNDNGLDESLWSGQNGADNYLFTQNNEKHNGDIVLISVFKKLKSEITSELKRAFPDAPKRKKKKDPKAPAAAGAATAKADDAGAKTADDGKAQDRISSVIIEEINKDHLLLRGRKNLLFKNRKRLVEIQALISRKDVLDNDTINSDNIIESNINIIR